MIYTIGVYGYSEEEFFGKLQTNGIKTFWDVRLRRGMRGSRYKFVNAKALEEKLGELNIIYRHVKALAPTQETREIQKGIDVSLGELKSERWELSVDFTDAYFKQLKNPEWENLAELIKREDGPVALFCVESLPSACHRSIAAEKISLLSNLQLSHII